MTKPRSLRHTVLHLMDYLGDAAKIAEHLDHAEDQEAVAKARALLDKRFRPSPAHWDVCSDALEDYLRAVAGKEYPSCRPCKPRDFRGPRLIVRPSSPLYEGGTGCK